ncbi:MAG: hypothetical protein K6T65_08835 [Peptococcaceae bacterium]|nr:hypothetical protein [Peptococcaceae bacterium]
MLKRLWHDQRGFMALPVFAIFLVMVLSGIFVALTAAWGAHKNAVMTYSWFENALDFAATAVDPDGKVTDYAAKTPEARQWFAYAFSRMVEGGWDGQNFHSPYKAFHGPIKLVSFQYAPPGTIAPGGVRTAKPGYEAVLEVPVFVGRLPFIGTQYVTVPMRQVGVVKTSAEFGS